MSDALVDDDFLASIDDVRGIADELGVAPYTVTVRVVTYSGDRVGHGTRTVKDTPVRVAGGSRNPSVALVTSKDVIASGGLYTATDLKVGPLTPAYAGGGVAVGTIDPAEGSVPTEVYFVITGPGVPAGGVLYKRVGAEMASATQYFVILHSLGIPATPP